MEKINPSDIFTITVKNWDKHQGHARKKSRAKQFGWFSLSNDFFEDYKVWQMGALTQQVFIYLLSQCSKNNTDTIQIPCSHIATRLSIGHSRVTARSLGGHWGIADSVLRLQELEIIELKITHNITVLDKSNTHNKTIILHNPKHPIVDSRLRDSVESRPPDMVEKVSVKIDQTPIQRIVEIWNETAGSAFPKVTTVSEKRKRQIRVRWKEKPDLDYWRSIFERMAKSTFMRDGTWATFDWVTKNDSNHVKVSEGNYDNPGESEADDERRIKLIEEDQARRAAEREAARGSA